jgi:hypothetical protein
MKEKEKIRSSTEEIHKSININISFSQEHRKLVSVIYTLTQLKDTANKPQWSNHRHEGQNIQLPSKNHAITKINYEVRICIYFFEGVIVIGNGMAGNEGDECTARRITGGGEGGGRDRRDVGEI